MIVVCGSLTCRNTIDTDNDTFSYCDKWEDHFCNEKCIEDRVSQANIMGFETIKRYLIDLQKQANHLQHESWVMSERLNETMEMLDSRVII